MSDADGSFANSTPATMTPDTCSEHENDHVDRPGLASVTGTCHNVRISTSTVRERHKMRHISSAKSLENHLYSRKDVVLDGHTLDLPALVAVARFGQSVRIHDKAVQKMQASVDLLAKELEAGHSIYGVTTGFGGSADANTDDVHNLQVALLQMQLCGVLPAYDPASRAGLSYDAGLAGTSMPEAWVRAAMLVRINALARGHSAVRPSVIHSLIALLNHDLVPFVPLRGSISASGDLSPLSYIAGALEGNLDVHVWTGPRSQRFLMPASEALRKYDIRPVRFGPKECLGILNGTAFSAAVGGLAMHEANGLALLAQVLTAMGTEALEGTSESFKPFFAIARPHRGQQEVAENISAALAGSKLTQDAGSSSSGSLRQDRYALRTASQWLGPGLEDLMLATEQLEVELNSTTDNPIFDVSSDQSLHGGNFQAVSVTSSTEKTRLALQMIGKLIFAQSTELLDPKMTQGLAPNLAFGEPSLNYSLKGVDINMAAYMAELAFLANPVSSHVQSAEMGNQSLNSMALVSCRYTSQAADVVSLMASAHLYTLCQALDLRALTLDFLKSYRPVFEDRCEECFDAIFSGRTDEMRGWKDELWVEFVEAFQLTVKDDSKVRFPNVASGMQPALLKLLRRCPRASAKDDEADRPAPAIPHDTDALALINRFSDEIADSALSDFVYERDRYSRSPDASPYLGKAAKKMYQFVRFELGVPLHRGLCDHPGSDDNPGKGPRRPGRMTTGTWISTIHEAVRSGRVAGVLRECF